MSYPEPTPGFSDVLESGLFSFTVLKLPTGRFQVPCYIIHAHVWDGHTAVVESLTSEREQLKTRVEAMHLAAEREAEKITRLEARIAKLTQPKTDSLGDLFGHV